MSEPTTTTIGKGTLHAVGNQPAQQAFIRDRAPGESYFSGGLGCGKSWAGARKLIILHALNECPGLVVAPTYGDLMRFCVPALTMALVESSIPFTSVLSGPKPHLAFLGQPVLLLSAETPERFAGFEVGHVWVDEAARCLSREDDPVRNFSIQVRTRLRHPAANALHLAFTGTPEGPDTWIERDFTPPLPPHRRVYRGSTKLNAALPEGYVDALLRSMPAALVPQYLEGIAVQHVVGRAHPGFGCERHVDAGAVMRPDLPLHVGCDFNVSPLCWVAGHIQGAGADATLTIVDELIIPDHAMVDTAIHAAHGRRWGSCAQVILHPDKSALARNTVSVPEIQALSDAAKACNWKFRIAPGTANPPVNSRVNLVDMLISPALGPARLRVAARCTRLIQELLTTRRLDSGHYDAGSKGDRGHILDALGYLVWDELRPGCRWAAG